MPLLSEHVDIVLLDHCAGAHVNVCKYVCELYRGTFSYNNHHNLLCEMELLTHKCICFVLFEFLDKD